VIPKNARNSDGAWEYIKLATDKTGGAQLASVVGALPTNRAAVTTITDPNTRLFLTAANDSAMPLLDSVIPAKVALLYYVQLQAAFAGKVTPLKAMQNVEAGLKTLNP